MKTLQKQLRKFLILITKVSFRPPSLKLVFKISFWLYVKERWSQTRTLIRPRSRWFKRSGRMQFMQKYLRISTWFQHIPIHNLPLEKDRKINKLSIWLPHTLNEKNKEDCISIATSFLSKQRNDPFLKDIITGDNVQQKGSESPQPTQKAKFYRRELMLCIWWDHHSIILFEFFNHYQTTNLNIYSQQLQHVHENILWKHSVHMCFSMITQSYIQQELHGKKFMYLGWSVLLYPLDLVPSDFHLSPSLQNALNNKKFSRSDENICGKLLRLETSWILLERNQQGTW